MSTLINSLIAFHVNGFSYLVYNVMSNFYVLIMIFCAVLTVLVNLKEVAEENVIEEQNIL